jgi:hypothetical protein
MRGHSNACAIQPGHGATLNEEAPEVLLVSERFENPPFKPCREVDGVLYPVVEHEVNPVLATGLGADDGWKKYHVAPLLPRRDPLECLALQHTVPVSLQLSSMRPRSALWQFTR